ncbi:dynactin subunit 3-like [Littorina saxatilis]|uniref:dynactin subunit 3-like n=1 Tax=Littorina saxatilis TaxID=31220 RepID=UPI0038B492FC
MADTSPLDVLEKRITDLESLVFGNADKDALYPKGKPPKVQCIESMLVLQNKIMAAVAGKKKLTSVYQNLPALRRYMDPAYTDEMGLSEEAKAEVIFAEEDYLRRVASQLQTVKEHDESLSSEHVKSVPTLSGKLQELSQIHIQQQRLSNPAKGRVICYMSAIAQMNTHTAAPVFGVRVVLPSAALRQIGAAKG